MSDLNYKMNRGTIVFSYDKLGGSRGQSILVLIVGAATPTWQLTTLAQVIILKPLVDITCLQHCHVNFSYNSINIKRNNAKEICQFRVDGQECTT